MPAAVGPGMGKHRHLWVGSLLGSLAVACAGGDAASVADESTEGGPKNGLGDGESRDGVSVTPGGGAAEAPASPAPPRGESEDGIDGAGFVEPGPAGPAALPSDDDALIGDGESPPSPVAPATPTGAAQSGLLTAGTWDDNLNFERFLAYRDELLEMQMAGLPSLDEDEFVSANEAGVGEPREHQTLDVSLVIDTTGSMGDELRYLQTEFDALSTAIENAYPEAKQRWSLVLYRDQRDEYVTRWFDFRNDLDEFRQLLDEQAAGGGGDFPEAPDAALDVMTQLAWRDSQNTARLAFWVADAPHHDDKADAFADAVRASQTLGIHIYPIASSGVDELTEFSMRASAQLTGGRYIFLTDDSGVGGAHKEPSIPCYFVTRLDSAILRMVDIEMSGVYREPSADEVIRASGDPQDGACTLESGKVVKIY